MFTLQLTGSDESLLNEYGLLWTCQSAVTARRESSKRAARAGAPVAVIRGGKVSYIMHPDGTRTAPLGTIAAPLESCSKGTGKACFCTPCRSERREHG